jgi:nitric oxide reductase NorE protein
MWVLIISELLVFSAFFILFAWQRAAEPALFNTAQQQLDPIIGGINTLVLLTSGYFAAQAVIAVKQQQTANCQRWLWAAMALGAVFCLVKMGEYIDKLSLGLYPETNTFFTYYYLLTFFHFAHVIFGLILLALACWRTNVEKTETATAFWHLVDLIWVLLYPLLYLMR